MNPAKEKGASVSSSNTNIYNSIVYIKDTINGVQWQGSGVLIAPDEVLTASHLVYDSGLGTAGTATNIVVTPGYNSGNSPFGSATGDYFHYNTIQDSDDSISEDQSQNDFAVIHLSKPFTNLGTMTIFPGFMSGTVTVSGYPAAAGGIQVNEQEIVTKDPTYSLLVGQSLGQGSSGGPVWTTDTQGNADLVGLISSGVAGSGGTGYFTEITQAAYGQIMRWVAQDEAQTPTVTPTSTPSPTPTATPSPTQSLLAVLDTSTGRAAAIAGQTYIGPVSGIEDQYINVTSDSLNVTLSTPNWFVHSGSGNDAITASSGTNVLDGGTGSNFLTGGSGTDTFFIDDRNPSADIWSTVANFHTGDAATIWGVSPSGFTFSWVDGQGATGYKGLTLHVTDAATPTASLTLTGYTSADLNDGRLSITYGTDASSGSAYMYVKA